MKENFSFMFISVMGLVVFPSMTHQAVQQNIVLIVADDLGWNDVSMHGSKQIPTPNIDVLGYDGVILNNYYVTPLCTPSRGSLMTGKYPIKLGLQHGVIENNEPYGLPLDEKLLPEYLRELGYATRGVGKWHLGFFKEDYIPTRRGFDSFFGYWTEFQDYYTHIHKGENITGYDFRDDERIAKEYNGSYATEIFTQKAKEIIQNHNQDKPLFLYLAHLAVHTGNSDDPLQVPARYTEQFSYIRDEARKVFAGMMSALDISVGEIMRALDEAQLLQNTIVIFTTDNGGSVQGLDGGTGSNFPLRGSKVTLFEGGIKGIAWIWSSELRKRSRNLEDKIHISDWLPTLYAAAGGNIKRLGNLDGVNQWPTIFGGHPSPRNTILHNIDPITGNEALVHKQYKIVKGTVLDGDFDGWFDRQGKNRSAAAKEKYSLECDKFAQIDESSTDFFRLRFQAAKILLKNYGPNFVEKLAAFKNEKLLINCGQGYENDKNVCFPTEAPCLFNIEKDPCEYNNLANQLPEVVSELEDLLDYYRQQSIPPGKKPPDPRGDPKYHDGYFVSWL